MNEDQATEQLKIVHDMSEDQGVKQLAKILIAYIQSKSKEDMGFKK